MTDHYIVNICAEFETPEDRNKLLKALKQLYHIETINANFQNFNIILFIYTSTPAIKITEQIKQYFNNVKIVSGYIQLYGWLETTRLH